MGFWLSSTNSSTKIRQTFHCHFLYKLFLVEFLLGMPLLGILNIADNDISLDTFGQFSIEEKM